MTTTARPNTNLTLAMKNRLGEARKDFFSIKAITAKMMPLLRQLDKRPGKEFETETRVATWYGLELKINYVVPEIPAMLPILEFFEDALGGEFSSQDTAEGARVFFLNFEHGASDKLCSVYLTVSPDEKLPDARCRKVLVGTEVHTYTSTTPRYEIRCD